MEPGGQEAAPSRVACLSTVPAPAGTPVAAPIRSLAAEGVKILMHSWNPASSAHNALRPAISLVSLLTDAQFAAKFAVAIRIRLLEVIQKAAALAHKHQQATAGAMILLVGLEMFGQFANALTEDRNLHFGTSRGRGVGAEFVDDVGFLSGCQHGSFLLLVL